jgi:hypothetical protein
MTDKNETINPRDFNARSAQDQQDFTQFTWCDTCQKENLGLSDPKEYEQGGTIFIEGKCKQCAQGVITEITDEDF